MEIWLVYPYGSIPGEGFRPDRANMLGEKLAQVGHKVTWWGSNFEHRTKKFRSNDWKDIHVSANLTTRLVPTTGYKKNISFNRIRSEIKFGKQILSKWKTFEKPDMIIMAEPSLFVCRRIMKIVKASKATIILDLGDLWPELFHIILPQKLFKLGYLLFYPLYERRRKLFNKVDAIIAINNSYLELARKIAPKLNEVTSVTVYFGMDVELQRELMKKSEALPAAIKKIQKKDDEVWVIYASTLGINYDVNTLLETCKELEKGNVNVKVIIAGAGPLSEYVRKFIEENKLEKTLYLGNPDTEAMAALYDFCDIGLSMYVRSSTVSMPIKAFHYFASGLAVINSLKNDLEKILKENEAGLNYEPENVQSLIQAIKTLVENKDLRKKMTSNSFRLGMLYDINNQYDKFLGVIENLQNKRNNDILQSINS